VTPSPPPASFSLPKPFPPRGIEPRLAPLSRQWLDQVTAIEQDSFANPWSRGLFSEELMSPVSMDRVALVGDPAQAIGFIILWLVAGEAQVQNLAVAPAWRSRGVGRWLLLSALHQARDLGARQCTLEVRSGNQKALALYESLGFARQGLRPRYYWPENEDAVLMGRGL